MGGGFQCKRMEHVITVNAFDCLLAALDCDRDLAGQKYELLRHKLTAFFGWRGMAFPEDLADQTLDVAARRLHEGESIHNLSGYCVGIARMILRKNRQTQDSNRVSRDLKIAAPSEDPIEEDPLTHCFEKCLQLLAGHSRELIYEYYCGDKREKIKARKKLAVPLGLEMNALRIRAFRIRTKLETAVRECMSRLAGAK